MLVLSSLYGFLTSLALGQAEKIYLMRISSFYNTYLNTKDFLFISCKSIGYIVSGNHTPPLDWGAQGRPLKRGTSLGKSLFLNTATCQYVWVVSIFRSTIF